MNGQIIVLPLDLAFEASDALIELLVHASLPFTLVQPQGNPTGRITIPATGGYGGRLPISINGTIQYLPIGTAFLPSQADLEVLANAMIPYCIEYDTGVAGFDFVVNQFGAYRINAFGAYAQRKAA